MPDIHAGAGCTIGTTMTVIDKVVPNLVGVDIGCGMECVQIADKQCNRLTEKDLDLKRLDEVIHDKIPSGFNIRNNFHPYFNICHLNDLYCIDHIDLKRAGKSIGTLGGGNHFIEVNVDNEGFCYLVVHTGSRHLGLEVAKYYQDIAIKSLKTISSLEIESLIARLVSTGQEKMIESAIKKLKATATSDIPKELAYVTGKDFDNYIHDMWIVQQFAIYNRQAIIDEIMKAMNWAEYNGFTTIHNYIDTESMILRKGAVSAKAGELLLIPINMRDGSLICRGKGNEDWNYSAPYGAGRLMSRTQAKKAFTVSEFEAQMKDVYTTSVNNSTLDECPMAYKNMEDIVDNIRPTVDIIKVIHPIYNFKAGE